MQAQGRRVRGALVTLLVAPSTLGEAAPFRVGYTVSRKVGGAVVRNRVRRRLREIVRTHPEWLATGRDYVVIAFPAAAVASSAALAGDLECLLEKLRRSARVP